MPSAGAPQQKGYWASRKCLKVSGGVGVEEEWEMVIQHWLSRAKCKLLQFVKVESSAIRTHFSTSCFISHLLKAEEVSVAQLALVNAVALTKQHYSHCIGLLHPPASIRQAIPAIEGSSCSSQLSLSFSNRKCVKWAISSVKIGWHWPWKTRAAWQWPTPKGLKSCRALWDTNISTSWDLLPWHGFCTSWQEDIKNGCGERKNKLSFRP